MRATLSRSRFLRTTTFEKILVYGVPQYDAPILMRRAMSVVTPGETVVRLLEPPTASPFVRVGVEPLDRVVDSLKRLGVPLRRDTTEEAAAEQLVEQATKGQHDLVIKGVAAGHEGGRTLTATDLALVRWCPCQVWFVECAEPRTSRRIVAAIDPHADDEPQRALAARVAAVSAGLADMLDSDLHVLHAWVAFGEHLLRSRMPPAELKEYVRAAREAAGHGSEEILTASGLGLPPSRVHFEKGALIPVLPRFVDEGDFDLVVLGTKGRKGWLDGVIRPHAEAALCRTRVSVMVVKGG